jgi:para-aminobenzoate synthetase component I
MGSMSATGGSAMRERARLEWFVTDGGDPATVLEDFLVAQGFPVHRMDRYGRSESTPTASPEVAIHLSADACATIAGAPLGAATPSPSVPDVIAIVYAGEPASDPVGDLRDAWSIGDWTPSWTPGEHAAAIRAVRDAIAEGEVYQVNVVGHSSAPYRGDPGAALLRVANLPGGRYPMVVRGTGWALACASPETLVEIHGGTVVTRPIKGTRPATAIGRRELLGSEKERAEHVMIVDLSRNDLARVAHTGSVRVDELYGIRRWSDLWQAESVVSATLAHGVSLAQVLRAVCPGGSVTGAPKLAALGQIAGLEPVGRGPSMGALGWLTRSGLDLGLTIRTVAVDPDRVHLWAGGGITWSSDPQAEVAEAAAKALPLRRLLAGHPAPGGRSSYR